MYNRDGTASRRGRLSDALGHDGADLAIAAAALEHGLTVVTRNRDHFAPTGVAVLDPSVREPPGSNTAGLRALLRLPQASHSAINHRARNRSARRARPHLGRAMSCRQDGIRTQQAKRAKGRSR